MSDLECALVRSGLGYKVESGCRIGQSQLFATETTESLCECGLIFTVAVGRRNKLQRDSLTYLELAYLVFVKTRFSIKSRIFIL